MRSLMDRLGLVAPLLLAGSAALAQTQFYEKDGVVSMEVENYSKRTGGWIKEQADDASGGAYMKSERKRSKTSKLEFIILFRKTGWYRVWLRATSTFHGDNDCFIWLDGVYGSIPIDGGWQTAAGVKNDSKTWGWASIAKTEAHTPRSLRDKGTWVNVKSPGTHTLQLGSRSKDFKVDKVILYEESVSKRPGGEGPAETVLTRAAMLPRRTTYVETGGVVSIEAELFTRNQGYTVRSDNGPTGKARGWSGSGWIFSASKTAKRLDYEIHFTKTGTYYVHLRALAGYNKDWGRDVSGIDNGYHAEFDGKRISGPGIYVLKPGKWDWFSRFQTGGGDQAVTLAVETPGKHTFSIVRREALSRLDKIVIHDGTYGTDSKGKLSGKGPQATVARAPVRKAARKPRGGGLIRLQRPKPKPKPNPLASLAEELRPIRAAENAGDHGKAIAGGRALLEKTALDHPARPALEVFVKALADARYLRRKVAQGIAAGKTERIFLPLAGRTRRVKLVAADERGLTVDLLGSEMPLPWSRLKPRTFAGMASRHIDPTSAADRLALARYCAANGLTKEAHEHGRKALALDPSARDHVKALGLHGLR